MNDFLPIFDHKPDSRPITIAGPCSAESEVQTIDTAKQLADMNITIFRAGVWKPRTKPGGFEGIGSPALEWLKTVKDTTGMKICTEIATVEHLRDALAAGIDGFWLGARTTANPFAVQAIADELSRLPQDIRHSITVLIKNPVNPDLELWIGAFERLYGAGMRRLGAIHRGFSSYGKSIYRNPPKWRIPIELHRRLPQLPIICDPSHIGGARDLILPISQQAMDMNFDGLIVECHCNPESALSDAAQQVTPAQLSTILGSLEMRRSTTSTDSLEMLRDQIDHIDRDIIELLAKRMRVSRDIGRYKKEHGMPVVQTNRYNALMQQRVNEAATLDLPEDFMRMLLSVIHEESVRQQLHIENL